MLHVVTDHYAYVPLSHTPIKPAHCDPALYRAQPVWWHLDTLGAALLSIIGVLGHLETYKVIFALQHIHNDENKFVHANNAVH